jgi:L-fuconolactonase
MPLIPIVDAHVHLWEHERFRMSWTDNDSLLSQGCPLEKYHEQTRDLPIEAMVFMECGVEPQYAFLEAQWAVGCTQRDARLQGVVAAAPVEFGTRTRAYLDALTALGPRVKGIRRNVQGEQDNTFCLQPDFVRGVQLLAEYHLSFDICIRHWQLPAVIELVRRCPDTAFILDHLGKPAIKEHILDPWCQQIRELAALPNAYCKVSGMVTEADSLHWTAADLSPYLTHVLECFGEDRVVFAGDWPVVLSASSYKRWVETLQTLCASLSPAAQHKLWHENARRFYRLAVDADKSL